MHAGDYNRLRSHLERSQRHTTASSPPCDLTSLAGDQSGLVLSVTISDEGGSRLGVLTAERLLSEPKVVVGICLCIQTA
jgi:hypothetical protein